MTDVTRKVEVEELLELLARTKIATAAWNDGGRPASMPVAFCYDNGQYEVGWPPGLAPGDVVVSLLVDAGANYFDLRGVRVRGQLTSVEGPAGSSLDWTNVTPARVTAWHYGSMRAR